MALFGQHRGPVPFIDEQGAFPGGGESSGGGLFNSGKKRSFGNKLADFLMYYAASRGSPVGQFALQQRARNQESERDAQREEAQRKQRIEDQYGLFERQERFKRDNPTPVNNDTINDYKFILENYGKPKADEFIQNRLINPPAPMILGPYDTLQGGGMPSMGAPSAPDLDSAPTVEEGFQYTPGPGGRANQGNWKPIGGASPSVGSPTFLGRP